MAVGDAETAVPAGEAIEDFGNLYPRPVGINRFTVLSLAEDGFTAYTCNIKELDCECRDKSFNRDLGEICKHLAVALYQAPDVQDFETQQVQSLTRDLRAVRDEVEVAVQKATDAKSHAATAADDVDEDQTTDDGQAFTGDPVEAFKSLLRDDGLDPDDFDIWVDDDYGSLQVDIDGFLDDDEFKTWVDLSNGLDMGYDGDSDHNYLQPDRFPEVFG